MSCNRCYDIHEAQKNGKTNNECKCCCHNDKVSPITWYNTVSTTAGTPTFTFDSNMSSYTPTCSCDTQPCETYHEIKNIKKVKPQEVPIGDDVEKNYKDKQKYTSCLCSMRETCSVCSPEW